MVLSRQTGTERELGTPSLRQHAMPLTLHPLLTPLLLSAMFSLSLSNPMIPPYFLLLSVPPSCLFLTPHILLLILTGLAVCCPTIRPKPNQHGPSSSSPNHPPRSPTEGDRALPSDYTWGAGLEYSPEGRQLSISDNCRERDTHTRVRTHSPPPHSFVNQGAIT